MRRRYLVSAVLAVGASLGVPAWAHDVKDPVCRMMVDSDTAKFKHKLGNKSFYFCSRQCQDSFAKAPAKYEKLAVQLENQDLHDYVVEFSATRPAVADRPVAMTFAIRYADTKELVADFELIHEKLLHLLMVTEDLAWFEHQHPVRGEDGIFRLTWRFPRPGRYRLYLDFTPADGDNQVKPIEFAVGGGGARTLPLRPDRRLTKQIGDYRVDLRLRPSSFRMEQGCVPTYTIRDRRGRLVRDMQPFIGAMGHLIAISQDGEEVLHTHALYANSGAGMAKAHLQVTPEMATETGPAFSFKLTLPKGGLYGTWAQFMHDNRVITVPFRFQVADLWDTTASVGAASKPGAVSGVQRATIVIDGAYRPATVTVAAGRPVQITFVLQEKAGCGNLVQFPSLGLKRALKPGKNAVVSFTPQKPGAITFTCGMQMYRGRVVVRSLRRLPAVIE